MKRNRFRASVDYGGHQPMKEKRLDFTNRLGDHGRQGSQLTVLKDLSLR